MTGRPKLPDDLLGLNVRDFFEDAVQRGPGNEFIVGRSGSLSYGEVDAMANQAASAWQELGVAKGDRVAFMADNSAEFIAAWLGLAKLGAVMAAVNTRFKSAEVQYVLDHSRPSYVLASLAHLDVVRASAAATGHSDRVLALGPSRHADDLLARIEAAGPDFSRVPLEAADVVSFIYTSGTTGRPKAVMQTHGNYVLTGQAYPTWMRLTRGETIYCCLPLFHVNAQAYSTMGSIGIGGRLALVERFSASRFWSDLRTMEADAFNYIGGHDRHPAQR